MTLNLTCYHVTLIITLVTEILKVKVLFVEHENKQTKASHEPGTFFTDL